MTSSHRAECCVFCPSSSSHHRTLCSLRLLTWSSISLREGVRLNHAVFQCLGAFSHQAKAHLEMGRAYANKTNQFVRQSQVRKCRLKILLLRPLSRHAARPRPPSPFTLLSPRCRILIFRSVASGAEFCRDFFPADERGGEDSSTPRIDCWRWPALLGGTGGDSRRCCCWRAPVGGGGLDPTQAHSSPGGLRRRIGELDTIWAHSSPGGFQRHTGGLESPAAFDERGLTLVPPRSRPRPRSGRQEQVRATKTKTPTTTKRQG